MRLDDAESAAEVQVQAVGNVRRDEERGKALNIDH